MTPQQQRAGLECSQKIADWLCLVQQPLFDGFPPAGYFPFQVLPDGQECPANNWNYAFASMGLLGAFKTFKDPRYETAALAMGRYMKSLQILDPFHGEHHGAIREVTPYTTWCYTRDSLSTAWGFIELYRYTHDSEYLERARLWGEWFLRKGCDEDGWPWWGHELEAPADKTLPGPQMCPQIHGSFQGGSLNFLYQLAKETGDQKWIGSPFRRIADRFVEHIQQPSGFYASIERATRKPPADDPQGGLHRANDDLGSLGLLCAYKVTRNPAYLASIEKYLTAVFAGQLADGRFEESVACIPVVLNILHEGSGIIRQPIVNPAVIDQALAALLDAQSDGRFNPRMCGGILEYGATHKTKPQSGGKSGVVVRSSCYALIVLQKLATGAGDYLTA